MARIASSARSSAPLGCSGRSKFNNIFHVAIETEKKFRLDAKQFAKLPDRLKKIGAEFAGEVFEENYLHRGGVLDNRDAVLRLRKTNNKTTLTYKESLRSVRDVKHKTEYETDVSDVNEMEEIIRQLGYRLSVVYEKRRRTWHLGKVEIVLDELPFGLYMEIEGTPRNIAVAEKKLGMKKLVPEMRGYPRLTVKYGRMKKSVMEARFKRSNGTKK
jgi:adenylate cyclase class 2